MTGLIRSADAFRSSIDRLFDRLMRWDDLVGPSDLTWPAMEVTEDKDSYRIDVEIPGVEPKDVQLTFEYGRLVVRGEKRQEKRSQEGTTHVLERRYGSFERSVMLPETADVDRAEATFRNGVLTISVPKREEARPRQIKIKT
jgi:HSP20 family protein